MNMKASLQITMGHHLTMTPQLQQAIRLLQLSTLDLNAEIQEAVQSNPFLEIEGQNETHVRNTSEESSEEESRAEEHTSSDTALNSDTLPSESPVDTAWEDVYPSASSKGQSSDEPTNFENLYGTTESLCDHLLWQMELTPFSRTDLVIANAIIESIDEDGFLQSDIEDILAIANDELEGEVNEVIELDEVLAVLHRIQRFDPVGVGARTLGECIYVQLQQLPAETPFLDEALQIAEHHLEQVAQRNYNHLMRTFKLNEIELNQTLLLIQSMNPRPGQIITKLNPEYVIPDVVVRQNEGRWTVELNPDALPKVTINQQYASMIPNEKGNATNTAFMRSNLQEARWFIKSVATRNETLLKVASKIVEYQRDFLEHGEVAMRALILSDVADSIGMHESTVSRVTTQKFMHTPRGIFELKYFFSSHVGTESGGEASSTAIRAVIKKLIAAENPMKPLSDSKLSMILREQGIFVARRTIAKYREVMNIASSNERKALLPNQ